MLVYTSITKSYLPKARVLARSVKQHHPDWVFVLLFSDKLPEGFDLTGEPFDEVLNIDELGIPDWKSWAFGHQVVELCTAVKGPAAAHLAERTGCDKIMYLDPDIKVFSSLKELEDLLDRHDILLTPHLLDAETSDGAIRDNEISALKHGIYNLGFFAATTRGQGRSFIHWWAQRLLRYCRDDIPGGLFTDQRWCDLAPAFFDRLHIVRDPGYNVATWNIAHRPLSLDVDGRYRVGSALLRFYHFTGFDSGDGLGMLMRYAAEQEVARSLWAEYGRDLKAAGQGEAVYRDWYYGSYHDGNSIPSQARRVYRDRKDVQAVFPDPYSIVEPCYRSWLAAELAAGQLFPSDVPKPRDSVREARRKLSGLFRRVRQLAAGYLGS